MRNQPLVSVVVPVYNADKYLKKCLYSITKQEYPNLEVILVNDGSTDESRQIIERHALKDSRFIVIDQKNGGVSSARNTGISLAKGEYITFIDADDLIHKEFISNLANDLIEKKADIVTTNKQIFSMSDSEFLTTPLSHDMAIQEYAPMRALEYLYSGSLEKGHNGVQMFRRCLINDNNLLYDTTMKIGEDFDFLARAIFKSNRVIYDPRDMYKYRLNDFGALGTMTEFQHYESMNNKQIFGRKILAKYPSIEKILNDNLCVESISCGVLLISVKDRYPEEFKQVATNIVTHKYSTLISRRIDIQNRIKVLILIIFGNTLGLQLVKTLTTKVKVSA
jgi:glycosyltransferase involved in cell wall biosynthesis